MNKKFLRYVAGMCMGLSVAGFVSGSKVVNAAPTNLELGNILTLVSSADISQASVGSLILDFIKVDYENLSDSDKKNFDAIRAAVASFGENNKFSSSMTSQTMDKEKQYDSIAGLLWNLIYGSTRWATDIATLTLNYLGMDYQGFAAMLSSVSSKVQFPLEVKGGSTSVTVPSVSQGSMNMDHVHTESKEISISSVKDALASIDLSSMSAKDIVNGLYNIIFSRQADESGLNFWMTQIEMGIKNGRSIEVIIEGMVARMLDSDELRNVK